MIFNNKYFQMLDMSLSHIGSEYKLPTRNSEEPSFVNIELLSGIRNVSMLTGKNQICAGAPHSSNEVCSLHFSRTRLSKILAVDKHAILRLFFIFPVI
jgi:hypothetical protein